MERSRSNGEQSPGAKEEADEDAEDDSETDCEVDDHDLVKPTTSSAASKW